MRDRSLARVRLRGQVRIENQEPLTIVGIVDSLSQKMRLEVEGPLGLRIGMLLWDEHWVQVYSPIHNRVWRLPRSEWSRPTPRREVFLKNFPLPADPQVVFQALSQRTGLTEVLSDLRGIRCEWDAEHQAQKWPWVPLESGEGQRLWLHAGQAQPLRIEGLQDVDSKRILYRAQYSDFIGMGPSLWARKLTLERFGGEVGSKKIEIHWSSAEGVSAPFPERAFAWKLPDSVRLEDL